MQRFDDLEHEHAALIESKSNLRGKVEDMGAAIARLEDENMSLVSRKLVQEDVCSVLEGQVESLTQTHEGLMI